MIKNKYIEGDILNGYKVLKKENRKKILLLSDDLRIPSGIGIMSKEIVLGTSHIFNWVQLGCAINHPEQGKVVDMSKEVEKETGVINSSLKIYPFPNYGNPEVLRMLILKEDPVAILHYTDPRQWIWLYNTEHEIRQHIPIFYYNIWDCPPPPYYNKKYYKSSDLIMNISRQTHGLVKTVLDGEFIDLESTKLKTGEDYNGKSLLAYVPHGVTEKQFKPLDFKKDEEVLRVKKDMLKAKSDEIDFVIFFNSRNIRRKMIGDLILSYKLFCQKIGEKKAEKTALVLHTSPVDQNGVDLIALIRDIAPNNNIILSVNKADTELMNRMYNIADVTVNISCLPPKTKIVTKQGYKNIEEIKEGELVYTHKGRFRKVLKTFSHYNEKDTLVKITPFNFNEIELTHSHKILCIRREKIADKLINETESFEDYIEWVEASKIRKSDLVLFPKLNEEEIIYENIVYDMSEYVESKRIKEENGQIYITQRYKINKYVKLDEDLAYLMGRWVGDGSGNEVAFDTKYGDEEILNLARIAKEKFGSYYKIKKIKDKNCKILSFNSFYSDAFVRFMDKTCRDKNRKKKVPDEVLFNKDIKIVESFYQGLYDADGTRYTKNINFRKFTNTSEILISQLQIMLLRLEKKIGIGINISGYTRKESGKNILYYEKNIRKKDSCSSRTWFRNNYYLLSVRKVEEKEYTGMVHNLEVEEDNSYVTDSHTVKNSNEGLGLSTVESLMAGTPIIVNVTGGLQDQCGFKDKDGNYLTLDKYGKDNWYTNHAGTYKEHGDWVKPVWPVSRSLQGSVPTPYIFDDRADWQDVTDALLYWYNMSRKERKERGLKGREFLLQNNMSANKMSELFIKNMNIALLHWTKRKRFEMIKVEKQNLNRPDGVII